MIQPIVTEKGLALIAEAMQTGTQSISIKFKKIELGKGSYNPKGNEVKLVTKEEETPVLYGRKDDGGFFEIESEFDQLPEGKEPYSVFEMGLYAARCVNGIEDPENSNILFSIISKQGVELAKRLTIHKLLVSFAHQIANIPQDKIVLGTSARLELVIAEQIATIATSIINGFSNQLTLIYERHIGRRP
jgi:hypothetical protein